MTSLKDKVVVITGASSGIGWSAALEFAGRGAKTALLARRHEKIRELAEKIGLLGGEALAVACDVGRKEQCRKSVQAVLERWGRIDVLVNNAGVLQRRTFLKQELEKMEETIQTNLLGTIYMTKEVLPVMKKQGGGHIVNVSSVAGHLGLPSMAVYCASKFALVGLTQALRVELYRSGVTLTAVCPGTVDTAMAEDALKEMSPAFKKGLRPKSPREIAEIIVKSCLRPKAEVICGETPAWLVRLAKNFPSLADWAVYRGFKKIRPKDLSLS